MDVVKTNIEKIGGTVDLQSEPGQGTTLQDQDSADAGDHPGADRHQRRRPLRDSPGEPAGTGAAGRRAGLPTHREDPRRAASIACAATCCRWSYLNRILEAAPRRAARPRSDPVAIIVVLQADDRQFGLVVDEINDTEEIVVKPLGKQLKGIPVFAGATIMGDGRVALILDVLGIARAAGMNCGAATASAPDPTWRPTPRGPSC